MGVTDTLKGIYRADGFVGFYRGCIPPFFGGMIFRSAQFTAYEASMSQTAKFKSLREHIPCTGGIEWRVLISGIVAGSTRSLLECPFEYAKVKGQTGQ